MVRVPAPCKGQCGRVVRPSKTTKQQWPNTWRWAGHGMCVDCLGVHGRPVVEAKDTFRPCAECGHMTRPKPMKVEFAPEGTRARIGELCAVCDAKERCAVDAVTPEKVRDMARQVVTYLRWRGREVSDELLEVAS